MSLHKAVTVIKYAGQRFSAKKYRIKYMYVLCMHVGLHILNTCITTGQIGGC